MKGIIIRRTTFIIGTVLTGIAGHMLYIGMPITCGLLLLIGIPLVSYGWEL